MKKNIRSSYAKYEANSDGNDRVEVKDYIELNKLYNKFLIRKALEGKEVTLPSRMGTLSVVGRRPKMRFDENSNIVGLAPDWVRTKEFWKKNPEAKEKKTLLYHTNPHTDGFRYKWMWSKNRVLVENKTLYALRLTRENKRAVYKAIMEGKQFKTV